MLVGSGQTFHFSGLPPTVLAFIPFAALPESVTAWGWVGLSVAAAILIVRRLKLSWWYLAFPPLVLGVYAGNPQIALLALLLVGAGPLGAVLKVYAVVPMAGEGRWRALALTGAIFAASVAVAPGLWTSWWDQLGGPSRPRWSAKRTAASPPGGSRGRSSSPRWSPCLSSRGTIDGQPAGSPCRRCGPPRSTTTRR